ncbi:microtubule-binding protein TANGLED-like isoform X1 [Vicia villosa]|uniref:microtubule-binding protein TANGLED-like isoform X1 n=1 Tax=Vicia villosa TaxID=3911 RepID=UPI00273C916F|nr:microtubule-binding protein TANGLED-like isoform X1 [Vicia villosa]
MVARTPPKLRKTLAALNPVLIRETLNKVDQCMARLQELQYTVTGGNKVVSGANLSPRSTRGYLRTSLRCKQESLRIKNSSTRKSPVGKFPSTPNTGEWRRMSLPAMLVGETIGEILHASQFAREVVSAVNCKTPSKEDPKTPTSQRPSKKTNLENTQLRTRRKKEKQTKLHNDGSPSLQKARSRITFKVSPPKVRDFDRENNKYLSLANRVSPRNRPWAKKAVLFPNPLFISTNASSSSSSQPQQQQFCKTRSPIISRNRGTTTPHKFLVKSPPSNSKVKPKSRTSNVSISPHKFLIKSPPSNSKVKLKSTAVSISPTRLAGLSKNSPKRSTASKFRRSFSPSRLATRLVSPLRGKKTAQKSDGIVSGLKQRPASTVQFPARRI